LGRAEGPHVKRAGSSAPPARPRTGGLGQPTRFTRGLSAGSLAVALLWFLSSLPAAAEEEVVLEPATRVPLVRAGVVLTLPAGLEVRDGPSLRPRDSLLLTFGRRKGGDWLYQCRVRVSDLPEGAKADLAAVAEGLKHTLSETFEQLKVLRVGPRRIAGMSGYAMDVAFVAEGRPRQALHRWFVRGRRVVQFALLVGPLDADDALRQLDAVMAGAQPLDLPRGVATSDAALTRAIAATERLAKDAPPEKLAELAGPPATFLIRQEGRIVGAAGYELTAEEKGAGFKAVTRLWFVGPDGAGFAQTLTMTAAAGAKEEAFQCTRWLLADGKPTGDQETVTAAVRDGRLVADRVQGAAREHLERLLPPTYLPQTLRGLVQRRLALGAEGDALLVTEFDVANFRMQEVLLTHCGREPIVQAGRPLAAVRTVELQMLEGQTITTFHDPATGSPLRRELGPLTLTPATLEEIRKTFPEFAK
jgi:hypothetical protein